MTDDFLSRDDAMRAALVHVASMHAEAEAARATRQRMIDIARSFGASWQDIGDACGMSRAMASKRFGRTTTTDGDTHS